MTDRCSIDGCSRQAYRRGLCDAHRQRLRRHGSPTSGRTPHGVPLKWIKDHIGYLGQDCIKWPFNKNSDGRGNVKIDGRTTSAARVLCSFAHGEPPTPGYEACHTCGNGHLLCMNQKHLYWGTKAQNQLDRVEQGTALRGEDSPQAKLTENDVRRIRLMSGVKTQAEIGGEFGISQTHVGNILSGNRWGWLT